MRGESRGPSIRLLIGDITGLFWIDLGDVIEGGELSSSIASEGFLLIRFFFEGFESSLRSAANLLPNLLIN